MKVKQELKSIVAQYNTIYEEDYTIPLGVWNYFNHYLFSKRAEFIIGIFSRIYEFYKFSNPKINLEDRGWKINLFILLNDVPVLEVIVIGAEIYILNYSNNYLMRITEDMSEDIKEILWPLLKY